VRRGRREKMRITISAAKLSQAHSQGRKKGRRLSSAEQKKERKNSDSSAIDFDDVVQKKRDIQGKRGKRGVLETNGG